MNMNNMIALKSLESSFLRQIFYFNLNILPLMKKVLMGGQRADALIG